MPENGIKCEGIMVMFKSLVSNTDQGTNQDDNCDYICEKP